MDGERQGFTPDTDSPDWRTWQDFWSAFDKKSSHLPSTGEATRTGQSGVMAGTLMVTVTVTVPYSTATVGATIRSTSVVTVSAATTYAYATTASSSSPQETRMSLTTSSASSTASTLSTSRVSPSPASSTALTLSTSRVSQSPAIGQPTASAWTASPSVITPTSDYGLPSVVTAYPTAELSSSNNATTEAMGVSNSDSHQQKRAIIGGLAGSIAGLVFVGLLICLTLRVRRKKQDSDLSSLAEKAEPRPPITKKFLGLATALPAAGTRRDLWKNAQLRPVSISAVSVDEEHRIIRMSTRHWPRPFIPGNGEGYRDSAPYGQLRVVNPDLSRPGTPRKSSETVGSLLRRQRDALAGFVFTASRPSSVTRSRPHSLGNEVSTIASVDPALARKCAPPYASTPSFRSYPSVTSLPTTYRYPGEDPLVTRSVERNKQLPRLPHEQQRKPTVQSGAGAASKTWTNLGSFIYTFRPKPDGVGAEPATSVRELSHLSTSTNSSRISRRSDPFDLDRPSIRGSIPAHAGHESHQEGHLPGWNLYAGT